MADPAVGLAAPAHAELDDPVAGLGYKGDDPDGYLSAATCRTTSTEYAADRRRR